MAALINGARIDEQIYEFGYKISDQETIWCDNYGEAVSMVAKKHHRPQLVMRCVYKTEWMEAYAEAL